MWTPPVVFERPWFSVAALLFMIAPGLADEVPALPRFDWTGSYIGAHMGAGHSDLDVSNPYGQSIFGGRVPTQEALVGLQGGYNWQLPDSGWVLGAEGDLTFFDSNGTNTCFAIFSAAFTNSTCSNNPIWLGALSGRAGYALGPSGASLLYLKLGTAFAQNRFVAIPNNTLLPAITGRATSDDTRWGLLLGAGLEQAVTPAWSVKFEYDFVNFGNHGFRSPATYQLTGPVTMAGVPGRAAHFSEMNHLFKVGLNYKLGEDPLAPGLASPVPARSPHWGFSFEPVVRYWHSTARFQKDIPRPVNGSQNVLVSRLTYDGMTTNSGEIAGRLDTPWNVFIKGIWGYGRIIGGHLNDEDWGGEPGMGYSNTLGVLRDSGHNYSIIDGGFDVFHGPGYRVGALAGYFHAKESYADFSCFSVTFDVCVPQPPYGHAGITETDKWNALRIGTAASWWLAPYLKFTADAAYLPYVIFSGIDNHWNRPLNAFEQGRGRGAQIEAILSYYFTEDFSLGFGGRYWSAWTTSGTDAINHSLISRFDTFMYERYGVFVEASYKFD